MSGSTAAAASLRSPRGTLARRLRASRSLALALDFDGTLAPLASHPGAVRVPAEARRLLRAWRTIPGVRVAVLSGRGLASLEAAIGEAHVHLVGSGGLETRAAGARRVHIARGAPLPPPLLKGLAAWCGRHPGAWLEKKGRAVAVHHRALALREHAAFRAGVRRLLARHASQVHAFLGKRVFEVLPRDAPDKGAALAAWRPATAPGTLLVYVGDDANDEPALAYARRRGGVAVLVGRRRSRATHAVHSQAAALRLLAWLTRAWERTHPALTRPKR